MTNLRTKFEVPNFTLYGNMKGVAKCRKWVVVVRGHPSLWAMSPFESAYDFLFVFNRNYKSVCLVPFMRYSFR